MKFSPTYTFSCIPLEKLDDVKGLFNKAERKAYLRFIKFPNLEICLVAMLTKNYINIEKIIALRKYTNFYYTITVYETSKNFHNWKFTSGLFWMRHDHLWLGNLKVKKNECGNHHVVNEVGNTILTMLLFSHFEARKLPKGSY